MQDSDGVYFDVYRKDEKAFNLSEGERNLVAFAYFIAKLEDVDTINEQPIIWIDDPISSLDSNHVFFIFSLIDQQIVSCRKGKQVFISTHNLDFLRYLKDYMSMTYQSLTFLKTERTKNEKRENVGSFLNAWEIVRLFILCQHI